MFIVSLSLHDHVVGELDVHCEIHDTIIWTAVDVVMPVIWCYVSEDSNEVPNQHGFLKN